jgi:hypothetical protein
VSFVRGIDSVRGIEPEPRGRTAVRGSGISTSGQPVERGSGDAGVRVTFRRVQVGDACPACANGILERSADAEKLRCEPAFAGERSCGREWERDGDEWERVDPGI